MSHGFKKDLTVTKLLRENKWFVDKRSFVTLPDSQGNAHLKLFGMDIAEQRNRVYARDSGRCQLKYLGCLDAAVEMDHKTSGLYGRCDCLSNLRMACRSCHRKRHVQVQLGTIPKGEK